MEYPNPPYSSRIWCKFCRGSYQLRLLHRLGSN